MAMLQYAKKEKYTTSSVADPVRRIQMFLGLPDPDQLVRDTDPDLSSSKNSEKNIDSYCFVTSS
jgi:hypothetical protein